MKVFWKKKSGFSDVPLSKTGDNENYFLKLALMGDGAVGKTNLRRSYLGVGFTEDHLMTIGADFAATEIELNHNEKMYNITYQIWDLAGQDTFYNVRSMYYRGCFGGLMVFDRTRPSSFDSIPGWINELKKHSGKGLVPIILLGNKYDLVENADEIVPQEKIDAYLEELNQETQKMGFSVKYFDTSALTGLNVSDAFEAIGEEILNWIQAKK